MTDESWADGPVDTSVRLGLGLKECYLQTYYYLI